MTALILAFSFAGIIPGLLMSIFCFQMTQSEAAAFWGFFVGAVLGMVGGAWTLWAMRESLIGWGAE